MEVRVMLGGEVWYTFFSFPMKRKQRCVISNPYTFTPSAERGEWEWSINPALITNVSTELNFISPLLFVFNLSLKKKKLSPVWAQSWILFLLCFQILNLWNWALGALWISTVMLSRDFSFWRQIKIFREIFERKSLQMIEFWEGVTRNGCLA